MNVHATLQPSSRVMVIDDDEDGCEEIMEMLRDSNFEAQTVKGKFGNRLDLLVDEIKLRDPEFVICDNRLQPRQLAQFYGIEVVRRLVALSCPAMLLTTYASPDRLALRRSRFDVPVIVQRDNFSPERLNDYYDVCRREINKDPVDARRPHRSLIRIESVTAGEMHQVDAIVSAWRPDHAVSIPIECISENLRDKVQSGMYLLGDVNIGAEHEDDLFFNNVNEVIDVPNEDLM